MSVAVLLDELFNIYCWVVVVWWVCGIDIPRFLFGWLTPDMSAIEDLFKI